MRKVLVWIVILALGVVNCNVSEARNIETQNPQTSIKGALESADKCKRQCAEQSISEWGNSKIGKKTAIFDRDNNITAYHVAVVKEGKNVGSIIVSVEIPNRVIEYTIEGKDFVEKARKEINLEFGVNEEHQKIYYLGGLNYAVGLDNDSKKCVDITTNNFNILTKKQMRNVEKSNECAESMVGKTPDNTGDSFITAPYKYEKGYISSKTKSVTNANLEYKIMKDYSNGQVCSPIAALNCIYYWYHRDKKKYKNLLDATWFKTYSKLFSYMGTSNKEGTSTKKIAPAYKKYIKGRKYSVTVNFHSGTNEGKDIVTEINKNRPCHLNVCKHYKYDNHSVLALGYEQYVYKHWYGKSYETYIRIADGWTRRPSRYVWGGCKGTWNYISIAIG